MTHSWLLCIDLGPCVTGCVMGEEWNLSELDLTIKPKPPLMCKKGALPIKSNSPVNMKLSQRAGSLGGGGLSTFSKSTHTHTYIGALLASVKCMEALRHTACSCRLHGCVALRSDGREEDRRRGRTTRREQQQQEEEEWRRTVSFL